MMDRILILVGFSSYMQEMHFIVDQKRKLKYHDNL